MYFICKENSYDFLVYRMLPVNAVFRNLQTNTGTQKFWSFRKEKLQQLPVRRSTEANAEQAHT